MTDTDTGEILKKQQRISSFLYFSFSIFRFIDLFGCVCVCVCVFFFFFFTFVFACVPAECCSFQEHACPQFPWRVATLSSHHKCCTRRNGSADEAALGFSKLILRGAEEEALACNIIENARIKLL